MPAPPQRATYRSLMALLGRGPNANSPRRDSRTAAGGQVILEYLDGLGVAVSLAPSIDRHRYALVREDRSIVFTTHGRYLHPVDCAVRLRSMDNYLPFEIRAMQKKSPRIISTPAGNQPDFVQADTGFDYEAPSNYELVGLYNNEEFLVTDGIVVSRDEEVVRPATDEEMRVLLEGPTMPSSPFDRMPTTDSEQADFYSRIHVSRPNTHAPYANTAYPPVPNGPSNQLGVIRTENGSFYPVPAISVTSDGPRQSTVNMILTRDMLRMIGYDSTQITRRIRTISAFFGVDFEMTGLGQWMATYRTNRPWQNRAGIVFPGPVAPVEEIPTTTPLDEFVDTSARDLAQTIVSDYITFTQADFANPWRVSTVTETETEF